MKKIALLIIAVFLANLTLTAQTKWTLDKSHTDIRFTAIHMVISEVDGEFKECEGSVVSTSDDFNDAEVEFVAKTASIDTDNERRDNHLRSDDFFSAESYPEVKFKGKIVKEGDQHFLVGDFTLRDVTQPIRFDVKYNGQIKGRRGQKAGFKITGSIDRFDYGLTWDSKIETGELVVSREIRITCNVELNEVTGS
jgi:polyisoprenoid-binding protein YceI